MLLLSLWKHGKFRWILWKYDVVYRRSEPWQLRLNRYFAPNLKSQFLDVLAFTYQGVDINYVWHCHVYNFVLDKTCSVRYFYLQLCQHKALTNIAEWMYVSLSFNAVFLNFGYNFICLRSDGRFYFMFMIVLCQNTVLVIKFKKILNSCSII